MMSQVSRVERTVFHMPYCGNLLLVPVSSRKIRIETKLLLIYGALPLAYVISGRLGKDKARRIAANIAKLPHLLQR